MVAGSLFLVIGIVLLFSRTQNSLLIGGVFVGGSIFHIVLGFIVTRFCPGFVLGIFESLRRKQ